MERRAHRATITRPPLISISILFLAFDPFVPFNSCPPPASEVHSASTKTGGCCCCCCATAWLPTPRTATSKSSSWAKVGGRACEAALSDSPDAPLRRSRGRHGMRIHRPRDAPTRIPAQLTPPRVLAPGRVGKTSLILRYVHQVFSETQQATIQVRSWRPLRARRGCEALSNALPRLRYPFAIGRPTRDAISIRV